MRSTKHAFLFAGLLAVAMLFALVSVAFAAPPVIGVGEGIPNGAHGTYPGYCLSCHPGFDVWPAPAINQGVTATHAFRGSTCTQCHVVNTPPPAVPATTTLTLAVPTTGAYAAATTVSGALKTSTGAAVAGESVTVQYSYDGATWKTLAVKTTSTSGGFSATAYPTRKTYFRAIHVASAGYKASTSPVRSTLPRVSLTVPATPLLVKKGVAFTANGYLKPAHTVGTFPVSLQAYRYEKQLNGTYKWVWRKTVLAKAYAYLTYTKYSTPVTLPYAGKWAIRAYHPADALNAATTTGWRFFTAQ